MDITKTTKLLNRLNESAQHDMSERHWEDDDGKAHGGDIEDDDPKCPKCGSSEVGRTGNGFKCRKCNHEWKPRNDGYEAGHRGEHK